jgi:hypothetical protein
LASLWGARSGRAAPRPPPTFADSNLSLSVSLSLASSTSKASGKLKILPSEPASDAARPSKSLIPTTRSADDSSTDDDAPSAIRRASVGGAEEEEEEEAVYHSERASKTLAQIPEGSMRRDARRLTRKARGNLPRVTAYSTAT